MFDTVSYSVDNNTATHIVCFHSGCTGKITVPGVGMTQETVDQYAEGLIVHSAECPAR